MQPNTLLSYTFHTLLQLFFSSLFICMFFSSAFAQPALRWGHDFDASSDITIKDIATDPNNNDIVVVGEFAGIADFDPNASSFTLSTGPLSHFIAKYAANGDFIWAKEMLGVISTHVSIDNYSNILLTGDFSGTVDFDFNAGTNNLSSQGLNDAYIAKYDQNANFRWVQGIGGPDNEGGQDIAVDNFGNVYAAGGLSFGSSSTTALNYPGTGFSVTGKRDFWVAKYNSLGNVLWMHSGGGRTNLTLNQDEVFALDVDQLGNVYIGGYFQDTLILSNGGATTHQADISDYNDIFFIKYTTGGNIDWVNVIGGTNVETIYDLKTDNATNSLFIAGYSYSDPIDFDPSPTTQYKYFQNLQGGFIAKYDLTTGNYLWANTFLEGDFFKIHPDQNGGIWATGYFSGVVDFDPSSSNYFLSSLPQPNNQHLTYYDPNGALGSAYNFTNTINGATNITLDSDGSILFTAKLDGTADIDLSSNTNNISTTFPKSFIAKYAPCELQHTTISFLNNDNHICNQDTVLLILNHKDSATCAYCPSEIYDANNTLFYSTNSLPDTVPFYQKGAFYTKAKGCPTVDTIFQIEQDIINPSIEAYPNNILCDADTVVLIVTNDSCNFCSYTWYINTPTIVFPVVPAQLPGAFNTTYFAPLYGDSIVEYLVQSMNSTSNCLAYDTIVISNKKSRIAGMNLASPMQPSDPVQDLNAGITFSTSPPIPAGVFSGPGVVGTDFDPAISGGGTHYISYSYTESGCTFTEIDTIVVIDTTTVGASFTNLNPSSNPYQNSEGCWRDSIEFTFFTSMPAGPAQTFDSIYFSNGQGGTIAVARYYDNMSPASGGQTITSRVVIPSGAKTGPVYTRSQAQITSISLGNIIINNADISFVVGKNPICSNDTVQLTGIPSGGVFSAIYPPATTASGVIVGTELHGPQVSSYLNGSKDVEITYTYTPSYGGGAGNACAQNVVLVDTVTVHNVELTSINFYPIAISESNVNIDSLIDVVLPDTARNYTEDFIGQGIGGTTGNYSFYPNTLSTGTYPITYKVTNAVGCINTVAGNINVIAAPQMTGLSGTQYCTTAGQENINRDPAYPYSSTTIGNITTEENIMETTITGGSYAPAPTPFGPYGTQANQYYIFNPAQAIPGQIIFTTTYRHTETTYSTISPFPVIGTKSYIVGSTIDTVLVGSGQNVEILDTTSVYCEEDIYYKIRLTPATGIFTIEKIGGGFSTSFTPNAAGEVFINPYLIHQLESTDTDYQMIYSFGAIGCADADTVQFTIPEPADASFATDKYPSLPLLPTYCKNETPDTLRPSILGGLFTINGFPSTSQTFKPQNLPANQNHTIIYSIPNSYGCLSQQIDTFRVNGLPPISFDTLLDNSYCVYSGNLPVNATPSGGSFTLYTRNNTQAMGSTFVLDPTSIPGIDSLADTITIEYSYTDLNGCTNLKQTNTIINPRPQVFMPNLADRYCIDPNSSISLSPTPTGGSFFFINQASSNFNTSTGTYIPASLTTGGNKDIVAYSYASPTTGCIDTLIDSTEVIGSGTTPSIVQKLDTAGNGVCFLGDTLELHVSPTPSLPDTASFASSAATPNGGIIFSSAATGIARFVPSQAAEGNIIVSYTYYDQSAGCSASASDTIVINPLPDLSMTIGASLDSVCQYTAAQTLGAYDGGNPLAMSSVNFWGNAVYNNQFYADSATAGTNFIQLAYVNTHNCTDTIRDSINVLINPFPILSGLNNIYCNSADADTIISSPGGGSWTPSGTPYLETPSGASYAIFKPQLAPIGTSTVNYTITHLNGCQNTLSTSVLVTGQPSLGFTQPTQTQFCNNDTLHQIVATANGLTIPYNLANFYIRETASGNLVANAIVKDSLFDPSAQTGALRLIVEYNDPNSGCVASDSTALLVTEAPIAAFTGLNNQRTYCIDQPAVSLNGGTTIATGGIDANNTAYTITGNSNAILNSSLLNATYYPDSMGGGVDTIVLTVTDLGGCVDTSMAVVTVRALPSGLSISGLDTALCSNQRELEILGFPQASLNTFYLLNSQDSLLDVDTTSNYYLQPPKFGIGNYKLVFKFTDNFSCVNSDTNAFSIHPSPDAGYQQLTHCYGDTIIIADRSTLDSSFTSSDSLQLWSWEYNGLAYGIGTDSLLKLANQPVGWGNVKLIVFTGTGCSDTITSQYPINNQVGDTIFVYTMPTTSFTTVGGCQGVPVSFKPDSSTLQPLFNQVPFDQLTNVHWNFGDGTDSTISAQSATNIGEFQYTYTQAGIYYPILNATNQNLCSSSDTFRLVISPKVSSYPYAEDFELNTGGWVQSDSEADSLWQWGIATGTDINTVADNDHIWATNLAGTYPSDSTAVWVYSPCFDFRYLQRPMIKMNRRSDMLLVDGASIDYFDPTAEEWITLGVRDKGINWYNVNSVFGLIGQKQEEGTLISGTLNGWSSSETSWMDARYRLDELKGKDNIRFRVNFGALNSANNTDYDGFAFDDVWIGERTRNTLVEYFSNHNYVNSVTGKTILDANKVVYNAIFNTHNARDVYLLEYHLDAPNIDPINAQSPADHNAREIQYGAINPANAIIDGNQYNGPYTGLSQDKFDYSMLQDPTFTIDISSLSIVGNTATVQTSVKAEKDIPTTDKYIVHVAIMEDTIDIAGDTIYNVLRKFLPAHESNVYIRPWIKDDTIQIQKTWSGISPTTYNTSRLEAIVFIQNDATSEIYQAATTRNLNFSNPCNNCAIGVDQVEENNTEIFDINLYPNPTQDYFHVEFPNALADDYEWQLWDIRGVQIQTGKIQEGASSQTINTRQLPSGSYIFGMYNEQHNVYIQRKVIILKP